MGAQGAGDAFLFLIMYILGQVISAYAITATLRMRSEELNGGADPILAAPVGRLRWAGSHLFFATIGPAVMLAALGLTIGLGYGLSAGDVWPPAAAPAGPHAGHSAGCLGDGWAGHGAVMACYRGSPCLRPGVRWRYFCYWNWPGSCSRSASRSSHLAVRPCALGDPSDCRAVDGLTAIRCRADRRRAGWLPPPRYWMMIAAELQDLSSNCYLTRVGTNVLLFHAVSELYNQHIGQRLISVRRADM